MPRAAKRQKNQKNAPPAGTARRQHRKRGWLRTVLFYLFFPFVVWSIAFLVWFYWYDLSRMFSKAADKPKAAFKSDSKVERVEKSDAHKPEEPVTNRSQEKLVDEDRHKLDAILKRLQERKAAND